LNHCAEDIDKTFPNSIGKCKLVSSINSSICCPIWTICKKCESKDWRNMVFRFNGTWNKV